MPVYTPVAQYNFDSDSEDPELDDDFFEDDEDAWGLDNGFGDCMPMSPLGASKRPSQNSYVRSKAAKASRKRGGQAGSNFFSFASNRHQSKHHWQMVPSPEDLGKLIPRPFDLSDDDLFRPLFGK